MSRVAIYIIMILGATSCATTRSIGDGGQYFDSVVADSAPQNPSMGALDYYLRGVYYTRHKDNDSLAREFLVRSLKIDSLYTPSMFELASISDFGADSTLRYIKKAVAIDSTNSWYRYLLSKIYANKGYMNDATYEAEKMIELGERGSETYQYMANLYQMSKRPIMAVTVLDSAMTLYGYQPELVSQKSEIFTAMGMNDKQIEFLNEVIANDIHNQRNYITLGLAYLQKGRDSIALSNFEKAREISAEDPIVPYTFMEYYRSKNQVTKFLSEVINIINNDYIPAESKISLIDPYLKNELLYRENFLMMNNVMTTLYYKYFNNYTVSKLYTRHKMNVGDLDGALKIYLRYSDSKEQEDKEDVKDAYKNVIGILTYQEKYDSAMLYYQRAMELLPGDVDITMMGVTIAYGSSDFNDAIKITRSTIKKIESDSLKSIQYGIIGDLYHETKNNKKTYSYYEKALELDSTNIAVLNNYSYHLSVEEIELERALQMIEKIVEKGTSLPTHIDTHAWILHKLGRNEEARKVMQRAIALDIDGDKTLYDHYAYILLELDNPTMARFYWDKALESGLSQEEYDQRIATLK